MELVCNILGKCIFLDEYNEDIIMSITFSSP